MERLSTRAIVAIGVGLAVVASIAIVTIDRGPTTISTVASSDVTSTEPTVVTTSPTESTTTVGQSTSTFAVFDEPAAILLFVPEFAAAIEDDDVEFLYERLHPAVKSTFDEDACREFIETEILALSDYQVAGPVVGPLDSEFGGFDITTYEVPVSFEFDGSSFDVSASFALTEGTVRWFAECR